MKVAEMQPVAPSLTPPPHVQGCDNKLGAFGGLCFYCGGPSRVSLSDVTGALFSMLVGCGGENSI